MSPLKFACPFFVGISFSSTKSVILSRFLKNYIKGGIMKKIIILIGVLLFLIAFFPIRIVYKEGVIFSIPTPHLPIVIISPVS